MPSNQGLSFFIYQIKTWVITMDKNHVILIPGFIDSAW